MTTRTSKLVSVSLMALTLLVPGRGSAQFDSADHKSPAVGTALSTLGTLLPMAVDPGLGLLAGLVVGPNLGDVYAGELGYAARRTGIRAALVGGTAALVYAICSGGGCTVLGKDGGSGTVAAAAVLTGVVATGVLAVREIDGVDDRIRERNDRSFPRVRMTPTLDLRGRRMGLAVGVRF